MSRPQTSPNPHSHLLRAACTGCLLTAGAAVAACGADGRASGPSRAVSDASAEAVEEGSSDAAADAGTAASRDASSGSQVDAARLLFASDVSPVRSVEEARDGVFIPPFESCRAADGGTELDPVCTQVSIAGATQPGRYFPDEADCAVVRRQRPYWPAAPAGQTDEADPRFDDAAYLDELAWVKEQIEASGCVCCHDSRTVPASQWDIAAGPLWLDTLSDTGVALFAGFADSSVLGAYPADQNNGFSRDVTGIPTSDPERMRSLMLAELVRRGLSQEWAEAVAPFGGPIYENSVKPPTACAADQGVLAGGRVEWGTAPARYVYVQREGALNPGVPPNLDRPEGTLWRLDVLASEPPLTTGIAYGTTPEGSFQVLPADRTAPALEEGERYKLVVLTDVGLPVVNCLFEYGAPVAQADAGAALLPDAGRGDAAGAAVDAGAGGGDAAVSCGLPGGDAQGFGAPCDDTVEHSDCPCEASYCAKSPFDAQGYCTRALDSCDDVGACPDGWSCFDVSVFQPGEPAICSKP